MPVYLVSFGFGTDHLTMFSSSLSGWFFFHSRVYQAQIDLNVELFLTSEMPLFKTVFFTRYLAYLVDKHLKSHWEFCKLWLSTCPVPLGDKYNILYWFWNTWSAIRLQYCWIFVFIYPIISHCEHQLERKCLAADENYSYTNVIFYKHVSLY